MLLPLLFAVLATLFSPHLSSAANYRVFEYYERLPEEYNGENKWSGYNFNETVVTSSDTAMYSMGASDLLIENTRYICVGWQDGTGTGVPASGSTKNVPPFSIKSDVSITWIYKKAYLLTIGTVPQTGALYGYGSNDYGQLGLGINSTKSAALLSKSDTTVKEWKAISTGSDHSAAITIEGYIYTWGNNSSGQLGTGNTTNASTPYRIPNNGAGFISVSAGTKSTMAIKNDGTLWGWGTNIYGQLGVESSATTLTYLSPVQIGNGTTWLSVTAGQDGYLAIKSDGTLWAWGYNYYGQTGTGSRDGVYTPRQVGSDRWSVVSAGANHAAGIKKDGSLWSWGYNYYGQIGNGTMVNSSVPVQIRVGSTWKDVSAGNVHTLGVQADGTLWSWGFGANSQLGYVATAYTTPKQVGTDKQWSGVAAGYYTSLATRNDGSTWGWGTGTFGVYAATRTITEPTLLAVYDWLQVSNGNSLSAGSEQLLVLKNNRSYIWGAGKNDKGQLGNSNATYSDILQQLHTGDFTVLSAGVYNHTAAIKADGSLWTWGRNDNGQLGDESSTTSTEPIHVQNGKYFTDVAAGSDTTAAIQTDGSLWTWGLGTLGQLGNGKMDTNFKAVKVGDDYDWLSVAAGQDYFMALKQNATLWSWGESAGGRLGYSGSDQSTPRQVGTDKWRMMAAGHSHSAGIKEDGTLWAWGVNYYGQVGDASPTDATEPKQIMIGSTWKTVAPGYGHTLAIREDGTLWAWGDNSYYQLGTDNTTTYKIPKQIGSDKDWRTVAAGHHFSMAIKTNGKLYVWGNGPFASSSSTPTSYHLPHLWGDDRDWLKLSVNRDGDSADNKFIMAIRANSSIEAKPHLGSRVLPADASYTITATAVPTNGDVAYSLSNYSGAGDISGAGTAYQVVIPALTQDTSVTWINEKPATPQVAITVNFKDSSTIPLKVRTHTSVIPAEGSMNIATGRSMTLSAPSTVPLDDGTVWECKGYIGSGDIPDADTVCSYTIATVTQAPTIT